jgi:ATP-dependent DNA ligase
MRLPIEPPVAPMLARLTRELPVGAYFYEPKWDGFRCIAFRDGDDVELWSRQLRPLGRYFPEVVDALRTVPHDRFVLDGEIILVGGEGFDFATLMSRLHPAATRVERLSRDHPAMYVAFDVLAVGDDDLRDERFSERRGRLQALLARVAAIRLTPSTRDVDTARGWFDRFQGAGVDGVVAKHEDLRYEAGRRSMVKVKHERTADCVLAGIRLLTPTTVSSMLLGLYAPDGELRHVGVVTQFPAAQRRELAETLRPLAIPLERHPWRNGFAIGASPLGRLKGSAARWTPDMEHDWLPLDPVRVVEVGFDQVDTDRFRHPARFRRWRPDRDPAECTLDQIEVDATALAAVLEPAAAR